MINIVEQDLLFERIGEKLKRPVNVFAIGGTAMILLGLKSTTKDIDLVTTSTEDRDLLAEALESINFIRFNPAKIYREKPHQPRMYTLGPTRIDLFTDQVIKFTFSKSMQKRFVEIHEYGNMMLHIANPQDIIIMKCATDRAKDKEDAKSIIKNVRLDWKQMIEEAKHQAELGTRDPVFELGEFLENLKNQGAKVPEEVLDKLYDILD